MRDFESREELDAFLAAYGHKTSRRNRCNIGFIEDGKLYYCCVIRDGDKAPAMIRKHYSDIDKFHSLVDGTITKLGASKRTTRYQKNSTRYMDTPDYVRESMEVYGIERFILWTGKEWKEYFLEEDNKTIKEIEP